MKNRGWPGWSCFPSVFEEIERVGWRCTSPSSAVVSSELREQKEKQSYVGVLSERSQVLEQYFISNSKYEVGSIISGIAKKFTSVSILKHVT